jgi:hypothetical protein
MVVTLRKLFLIFLPLTDNEGVPFAKSEFVEVSRALTIRFGGMTRMRTEREISFVGEWLDPQTGKLYQDEVIQCWIIADISAAWPAFCAAFSV